MLYELAQLQIAERQRDSDRASLARLARPNRSESLMHTLRQRLARSRRRIVAPAA